VCVVSSYEKKESPNIVGFLVWIVLLVIGIAIYDDLPAWLMFFGI